MTALLRGPWLVRRRGVRICPTGGRRFYIQTLAMLRSRVTPLTSYSALNKLDLISLSMPLASPMDLMKSGMNRD